MIGQLTEDELDDVVPPDPPSSTGVTVLSLNENV